MGRLPVQNAEKLVADLREAMDLDGLNQAQLALRLDVSKSTICRALSDGAVSAALRRKAEAWLVRRSQGGGAIDELHILRKTFTLLQSLHVKLDALTVRVAASGTEGGDV